MYTYSLIVKTKRYLLNNINVNSGFLGGVKAFSHELECMLCKCADVCPSADSVTEGILNLIKEINVIH